MEKKEIFNKAQRGYIKKACQIQIDSLIELSITKSGIKKIKEKLMDFHADDDTDNVEIRVQILENIKVFKAIKKEPYTLFKQKEEHITFITHILAEFFEEEWAQGFDGDFIKLINKIILQEGLNLPENQN